MNTARRAIKKVKVLGYPFAGGQPLGGVELTPTWLQNQAWFKDLANSRSMPVEYEEIAVSSPHCNSKQIDKQADGPAAGEHVDAKNIDHVIASSEQLRNQTVKALQDGYFPIVLGGDHSQAIGSVAGFKKMYKDGKIIWMDAHIDANTPMSSPSRNAHGMPLAYLSGLVPMHKHWNCVDVEKDLCYFGIRSYEEDEEALIKEKEVLVFDSAYCTPDKLNTINRDINNYFNHVAGETKYWISFDIDGVDAKHFLSTGTDEGNGLSLEFMDAFFERYIPKAVGMDFTEVNFELTEGAIRQRDEQTFKDIFEHICHQVNQPAIEEDLLQMSDAEEKSRFRF